MASTAAALISLKHNLIQLHDLAERDKICWPEESEQTCIDLYGMVCSIQVLLEENYPLLEEKGEYNLEKEMRAALWRAEDVVDSCLSTLFLISSSSESESSISTHAASQLGQDLLEVKQDIESIKKRVEKFEEDFKFEEEDEELRAEKKISLVDSSSSYGPPPRENRTVGLDGELWFLKEKIFGERRQQLGYLLVYGMGGIGKTTLARTFYNDSDVRNHFCIGAWVRISLKHCVGDILLNLLLTAEEFGDQGKLVAENLKYHNCTVQEMDDERLENLVREVFAPKTYLVVVDCLCDVVESSWAYIKSLLPDSNNGSRIILVNRMRISDGDDFQFYRHKKFFLHKSDSWNLLREKVFGHEDQSCPPPLERIGKRIAHNCDGLPLAIITVGLHLAKEEKTVEYWNRVAESRNSIAYAADGEAMYQQLGLSYKQTPPHTRPSFLYMGAFPQNQEISKSHLGNLWAAEGFFEPDEWNDYKGLAWECISSFLDRNVVADKEGKVRSERFYYLHHAMWHFACDEAEKEEFFNVVDNYHDRYSPRDIDVNLRRRRLIIQNSVLIGARKLKHSLLKNIRSLLFTAPYHPYPLRISFGSYKLLKVLNALSIRFYEFPTEILSLTLLRYLALTINRGDLPAGISKLRNLEFLIVHLHHHIVRSFEEGSLSYLPMEVWEMQSLIHLECMGSDLPIPPEYSDALLPRLLTLWGVSSHSCAKDVLKRIPNLTDLGININLAPKHDTGTPPLCPFDHLDVLECLRDLKCEITNPYFYGNSTQPQVVAMPENVSVFRDSLTSLTLSGCGFPWESMEQISRLPVLVRLTLQCHAFRGPKWELTNSTGFKKIKSLVLEDLDLIDWIATSRDIQFFPSLAYLVITRCHKLQQISPDFVNGSKLQFIVVADCSRVVETWAEFIHKELSPAGKMTLLIYNQKGAPIVME